jgi:hypothetical protein
MSRSAKLLLESLTDKDIVELDVIVTAACMADAFGQDPRKVFKREKRKHTGKLKRMLSAFHKASNIDMILNNHAVILEKQYEK